LLKTSIRTKNAELTSGELGNRSLVRWRRRGGKGGQKCGKKWKKTIQRSEKGRIELRSKEHGKEGDDRKKRQQ